MGVPAVLMRGYAVAMVIAVSDPSDQELVARMARGDESALGALYDRYAPVALALAMRVTENRAEGEDVLQGVFLRIWEGAERFDASRGAVSSWILASVRNASIDRVRRRQAHDRAVRESAVPVPAAPAAAVDPDSAKRIRTAMESLPADQREAIELAYFQGMTQSEIAEKVGAPIGTIKTRLRLGMSRLRDAMAGQVEKT